MQSSRKPGLAPAVPSAPDSVIVELYRKSGAEKLGLTPLDFREILHEVGAKYLPADASQGEVLELLTGLQIEELALARACAKGSEPAWGLFLSRYREKLYNAARSIAKEESSARELADSLYADLFGTRAREGQRVSKLNSYTGRGSLEGWLRTVLAQEYVNRFRTQRRLVSLEEQTEAGVQFRAQNAGSPQPSEPRLETATDEALLALSAEEKFILACYYLDGRTLAEIARILGVHESTISRKIDRTTSETRKLILKRLLERGMSAKEAEEALQTDVRDFSLDVRGRLMQEKGEPTVP